MKKLKYILLVVSLTIIGGTISFAQSSFFQSLRVDANLNYANKKRSYGVYSGEKYANSGYFVGYDFGLRFEDKKFEYGVEYYSPFNHWNISLGYGELELPQSGGFKFVPDVKLGYSPLLKKVYYGFGASIRVKWFSFGYNKLLHVKSGNSQYHGDGLDCFNVGVILRIPHKETSDTQ